MRQYNPYTEANMMGAWFESQANRLPAVLTDVELDKLAGDPVDIVVEGRVVARGEVLVLNDKFCVRIAEILAQPHM